MKAVASDCEGRKDGLQKVLTARTQSEATAFQYPFQQKS